MASSLSLKLFNPQGEYAASARYYEDAAAFVAILGAGAQVRVGHGKRATVWTEGAEEFSAAESYDGAARIMRERRAVQAAALRKSLDEQTARWRAGQGG